jgi:hypothetical protein
MHPTRSPAANQPRVGLGTDAPAGDQTPTPAPTPATRPTGRQAPGVASGAPIPPASDPRGESTGGSTGGSRRHRGPPRARLALLTWAGASALILGVLGVGGPAPAGWPLGLRALVVSGPMVAATTWVIVPVTTRLLRGWLTRSPSAAHHPRVGVVRGTRP